VIFLRWLFHRELIARGRLELVLLRVAFALLLFWNLPSEAARWTGQPHPHGFGQWIDFTFAANPTWFSMGWIASVIGIALYAAGLGIVIPLGVVLIFQIAVSTLNLSQGTPGHAGQIMMLTVLGQWLMGVWQAVSHGRHGKELFVPSWATQGLAVEGGRQAIVATYLVAGITKLINSSGEWLARSDNFVLQMRKTINERWFTEGEGATALQLGFEKFLLDYPNGATLFLTGGLMLELTAPLALLNRRLSLLFGFGLLAFHLLNEVLMDLPFAANQRLLVVFFIVAGLPWASFASVVARARR
jgi:hypothetical protein